MHVIIQQTITHEFWKWGHSIKRNIHDRFFYVVYDVREGGGIFPWKIYFGFNVTYIYINLDSPDEQTSIFETLVDN